MYRPPTCLRRRSRPGVAVLLTLALVPATALANEITGTAGDDTLAGTGADDTISGLAGNDRLSGGGGNDTLDGGLGADDMAGGTGRDAVSYALSGGVTVILDDLANDGTPDEQDNAQTDIEDVFGGPAADTLEGNASDNTLDAGAGDDRLIGRGGTDAMFGGDGVDRLYARDGLADTLNCGSGEDIAFVDTEDQLTDCEIVDRRETRPRADGTIRNNWVLFPSYTMNNLLQVVQPSPSATTIEVRCHGRGCPYARRKVELRRSRTVTLHKPFRDRRLASGTSVEVRITAAERIGKVVRYTVRNAKPPRRSFFCVRPRESRLRKSC